MVRIPRRLDEILPAAAMEKVLDVLQQPDLSNKVREAMNLVGLRDSPLDKVKDAWQQARSWLDSLADSPSGAKDNPTTLNATGQLFTAELCSVPEAASVAYGYARAATNYQRADALRRRAESTASGVFPAQSAAWLTGTSEALQLLVGSQRARDGVVISRTDTVRIPGLGDVRSMLAQGPSPVVEVGASNRVSADDWKNGLNSSSQLLLLCSPNNLSAAEAVRCRTEAIQAARACGACVVELLADGVICAGLAGIYDFPDARQRLATGADVVVLPLDILLGGPRGALVVGDPLLVEAVKKSAESTAVLLSGAALVAATIAIQIGSLADEAELGVAAQLLVNPDNLKNRARRIAVQLSGVGEVAEAGEFEKTTELGDAPWNRYRIKSWGVRLTPKNSLEELTGQLSEGAAALGYSIEANLEPQALVLDLRFVPPENDHDLVASLTGKELECSHPPAAEQ